MQPHDTAPEGAVLIPLRGRDRKTVRAYAIVDVADAEWVNQWRWHLAGGGYATRSEYVGGGHHAKIQNFQLHRELLGLKRGDPMEGDHINRDRLDCRRLNLRVLTRDANAQNRPSARGSSSSYRGVSWHKGNRKWSARVSVDGKDRHLGDFDSETEAATVARNARLRLMPSAVD